jgi:hypothetical protein
LELRVKPGTAIDDRPSSATYMRNSTKNICDIETTPPMKNPTAMELWNLRMIMVPPMLRRQSIAADQKLANPSENGRVPITAKDMSMRRTVSPKIEYLSRGVRRRTVRNRWNDTRSHFRTAGSSKRRLFSDTTRHDTTNVVVAPYHHPAMSFRDDPPHSLLARYVV